MVACPFLMVVGLDMFFYKQGQRDGVASDASSTLCSVIENIYLEERGSEGGVFERSQRGGGGGEEEGQIRSSCWEQIWLRS